MTESRYLSKTIIYCLLFTKIKIKMYFFIRPNNNF